MLTDREYRLRLAWIDKQWNLPDRGDYYSMRICSQIERLINVQPTVKRFNDSVDINSFKVKFTAAKPQKEVPLTLEQAANRSKAMWFGRLGLVRDKSSDRNRN